MPLPHVIIVGGGVGGLAAAVRLGASGRARVTLLEKNPRVGGKLNLWTAPHPARLHDRPFAFDTGPSLLTLPWVFEDLFRAADTRLENHLTLERLDPIARYAWADGTTFDARATRADLDRELARLAPNDLAGFGRLAARGKAIWDLSADLFLQHAPEQVINGGNGFDPAAALGMLTVPFRIGMFQKYAWLVDRHVRSQKLREVLYQYATYSGASPFRAPATLAVIPHAEFHFGGWYVRGGLYEIARALETIARGLRVEIRTGVEVERIECAAGPARGSRRARATGVRLADGTVLPADAVLANADVVHTYRRLIAPEFRRKYSDRTLDALDPGGSGLVLMLGVDRTYPHLAHHNKFMPRDYTSDLRAMFETRTVPDDPCVYVCAATRTDPTVAPDGCENLFVLASAPALSGGGAIDWAAEGPRYRDQLVSTLETRWGLTDLSKHIVVERRMTPLDLQQTYNANAGSIYGIGSNSLKTAFLRPPNRDKEIAGLYFAGGATHPGGGLPLVALSGKIASELVLEELAGHTSGVILEVPQPSS